MMALGFTFLLVMQYLFPTPQQPEAAAPAPAPAARSSRPAAASAPAPVVTSDFNPTTDYTITVRSGNEDKDGTGYEAVFSTIGGGLERYRLLGYFRTPGDTSDANRITLLDRMAADRGNLRIASLTSGPGRNELQTRTLHDARYELVEIPANAVVTPTPGDNVKRGANLVMRTVTGDWELLRTYSFPPSANVPDLSIKFGLQWRNLSQQTLLMDEYNIAGPAGLQPDDESPNFGVINILTARQPSEQSTSVEIERMAATAIKDEQGMQSPDNRSPIAWLGAKNRFFAAIMTLDTANLQDSYGAIRSMFAPDSNRLPTSKDMVENLKSQPIVSTDRGALPVFEDVQLAVRPGAIPPGDTYQAQYLLYAGPAVDTIMENADARLRGVVSYTISYLDFISRWLVQLLTFFDSILGNYGLAIIVVTIVIKLLLHPLNRKSFVSMSKMSKLAPLMKEIQKKYSNDRVKLQQEMSKFYKDHGVSMAGGCLPIFLQLPIFFALYGAFAQGFSMRHAAFIPGWIQDLSKPDSVYDLGYQLPLLSSSHISLLPILYFGLQYLQMSLQPKPSDPQQAQQQKIMKFMPLMFVFIFYSMPAGLVLYFTVSALAGVLENWWMRNRLLPRLGLGDTPEAAEQSAQTAQAGAGAAVVPSDAKKRRRK